MITAKATKQHMNVAKIAASTNKSASLTVFEAAVREMNATGMEVNAANCFFVGRLVGELLEASDRGCLDFLGERPV
jgi:hypothetical protein